ncbi:MAG TPA: 16S rRNA (guanine(966)-N(2))-methyltransferase RsmD [Vicinamibacterales bacterium]
MSLRIIAGSLKGRRIDSPEWEGLRPTSDRLRETLFNILAARVDGALVLDGCAGTGALGIEALSRGASEVVFVESDPRAASLIAANLARCGVSDGYAIIRADLGRVNEPAGSRRFGLILLDPPYAAPDVECLLARAARWLAPDGWLVLEHARRRTVPVHAGDLTCVRAVRSGDSALSFYRHDDAERLPAGTDGHRVDHEADEDGQDD